jgi:glutathione S-transferase
MYKLFYYPRNASWAPHLLLAELGVDYELILVDRKTQQQKSPDYLALNPSGRIPTLVDDQFVIFESAAICLYLCEKHPDANLIPALIDPQRATFYQWLFYLNASLQPELMLYFYPEKHTQGTELKPIAAAQAARITAMLALIDQELTNKEFLLGEHLSVCDYFLFMLAHWASDLSHPPLSFEHLGRYLRKLAQRAAVKSVCDLEGTNLDIYR